jgi:hypothetical protein
MSRLRRALRTPARALWAQRALGNCPRGWRFGSGEGEVAVDEVSDRFERGVA